MDFKTRNKLTVGLTGGILCGKSTALSVWKQAGAYVVSCDELVRQISARPAVQKRIVSALGVSTSTDLASKVFNSTSARKKLEAILHPLVQKEVTRCLKAASADVRVVEVPLLFEAGWETYFDLTVALVSTQKLLATRAKQRGITQTDFVKRSKAQWPVAVKASRADICISSEAA